MKQWKTGCKVGGVHDGLAHIVEQDYDDHFKVRYDCIDLTVDTANFPQATALGSSLVGSNAEMALPNGRSMQVRIQECENREQSLVQDGVAPSSYLKCYFVSLTPLLNLADLIANPGQYFAPKG